MKPLAPITTAELANEHGRLVMKGFAEGLTLIEEARLVELRRELEQREMRGRLVAFAERIPPRWSGSVGRA